MRTINYLARGFLIVLIGIAAFNAGAVATDQTDDRAAIAERVSTVYTSQLGVRELTGNNDGVEVEQYLAVTGFQKGASWCAAFIAWTFIQADVSAIHNAWSPAWFPSAKVIYEKGKPITITPDKADVFGIYFSNLKRIAHVGFVDSWPPGEYLITVEGNTNSAGSREGDGVYRKRRLKSNIHKVSRWI